ncbi:MAG: helix-turn-helix domain-containing protein [Lachnospiraceae bacterium]|nr:helix-turn-helix domain-containing protein [Lachnospiraceae bacterium]
MEVKLTIQERLKDLRVVDKHLTLEQLAEQTGLSRSALGNYESNDFKDISPFAIVTLAKFYGVSTDYLLGLSENKNHPNTELQALHLNDDMVDLLSNGRINNRLLCEMALHPGFLQFMTDIEICVDRIADMHINDMNQLLEKMRQTIVEKYSPEENDLNVRTLELAQVSEDMFYSHVIHNDLDAIVKDIRAAHQKDRTTADPDHDTATTTEQVQEMMNKALSYEGTVNQKRAYLVCQMLQINYESIPSEDRKVFERVCARSLMFPSDIRQRGKAASFPKKKSGKGKRKK